MDHLIRDKFEHFNPEPPPHVWEGVKAGIAGQVKPGFFQLHGRKIAAAAVILLMVSFGLYMILPTGTSTIDEQELTTITGDDVSQNAGEDQSNLSDNADQDADPEPEEAAVSVTDLNEDTQITATHEQEQMAEVTAPNPVSDESQVVDKDYPVGQQIDETSTDISGYRENNVLTLNNMLSLSTAIENDSDADIVDVQADIQPISFESEKSNGRNWSHGIYFTPEMILNDFDSVRVLPSYSLNYEPTYQFSKHWFLRFGLGLTYARERGFAKLDYISNDMVGTYEDVYDVTFDTIDGKVVPTYHTKTTEVWDSVRHIKVEEITNQYLYLQTPLLIGYNGSSNKFSWYFYAGPAFNLRVGEWIEKPEDQVGDVDIINLENNLPKRSSFYMQMWVGAGIQYKVAKQMAIAFEPNYRYHFNHVYDDPRFNSSLSGFALRFGVVINVK
jgi:hypothetical protein